MLRQILFIAMSVISVSMFVGCGDETTSAPTDSTTSSTSTSSTSSSTTSSTNTTTTTTTTTTVADINGTTFSKCQGCHVTPPISNHMAIKTMYLCSSCHDSLTAYGALVYGNTPGNNTSHVAAAHAIKHPNNFVALNHIAAAKADMNSCTIAACHGADLKLNGCNTCHGIKPSDVNH